MHLQRFHQWLAAAPAQSRAEAAMALVNAYSHVGRDRQRIDRLDQMIAILLEDSSVTVRRALAEAAARSVDVPRFAVVALAQDDAPVAVPVLSGSPLLSETDLVEAVAAGDSEAQLAIASRASLSQAVAAALVEAAHHDVVLTLCANSGATLPPVVLRRILERHGEHAEIREALLVHAHRDPTLHHALLLASADALTRFAMDCAWMSPARASSVRRESHDKGAIAIAEQSRHALGPDGPRALVVHLRAHGQLTPALLLRALLSGNTDLCESAFSHLAGVAPARVAGHLRAPMGLGFASLYTRAGMPTALLPVFRAALRSAVALQEPHLSRVAITDVMQACLKAGTSDLDRVMTLLRRLEAEALREQARGWELEQEPVRHPSAPDLAALRATHVPDQIAFHAAA